MLGDNAVSQQQQLASPHEISLEQTLVEEVVEPGPSSANPTLPSESDANTAHVSFVSSDLLGQGAILPMVPLPSPEVCSFDWNSLVEPHLPSYISFQIVVEGLSSTIHLTIIDEGASISVLSSMAWQCLGSPNLVPSSNQLLAFKRNTSEPLGVLPQMPIALGGKIIFIDVMVVQGPVDFNLLLGRDCIYAMKAIVSTLFRVFHFPHDGNMVTIDQLSFTNNCTTFAHPISLSVPKIQAVSPPPQAYYVATCPIKSIANDNGPLLSCSPSMDLVSTTDLVTPMMGALEPSLPPIDPSGYSF